MKNETDEEFLKRVRELSGGNELDEEFLKRARGLSQEELEAEMTRNLRLVNLNLNLPVKYESSVSLTGERKEFYKNCGNFAATLRNMVADNIKIEDIVELFNSSSFFNFTRDQIIDLLLKHNLIEKNCEEIE
jgi:hypothetical protein